LSANSLPPDFVRRVADLEKAVFQLQRDRPAAGPTRFNDLEDVDPKPIAGGQFLMYDRSTGLWTAGHLRWGSGVPAAGAGSSGDYFLRADTPGTANQRLYVHNGAGWVGIA